MNFYECSICGQLNGAFRLHCQCCGVVPAQYSMTGKPQPIVAAHGCERQQQHHAQRIILKTQELDYYAGA